jgi:hypothetical protein
VNHSISVSWKKASTSTAGLVASMIVLSAPAPAVAQDYLGALLQADSRAAPTGASPKSSTAPIEGLFRIGRTSIYCMRKPCPWRGITKIREDGLTDGKPVWAGDELPIIEASPADRERIRSSWQDSGCLLAQGRFEGQRLVVRHVAGDC